MTAMCTGGTSDGTVEEGFSEEVGFSFCPPSKREWAGFSSKSSLQKNALQTGQSRQRRQRGKPVQEVMEEPLAANSFTSLLRRAKALREFRGTILNTEELWGTK